MRHLESKSNPTVKHLLKLKEDSGYRHEVKKIFVEGAVLISELQDYHPIPYTGSSDVAKKLGGEHFAEFPMPEEGIPKTVKRLLVLDQVRDPGNLGTLARTALALNWDGIFLLSNCCDPFNDKVIRASKGAFFKIPYKRGSWEEFDMICKDLPVFSADLAGERPCFLEKCALILGNEVEGLSQEAKLRGKPISIPMKGRMESLNVSAAGAILMYAIGQK